MKWPLVNLLRFQNGCVSWIQYEGSELFWFWQVSPLGQPGGDSSDGDGGNFHDADGGGHCHGSLGDGDGET